jgi:hypothetical protein
MTRHRLIITAVALASLAVPSAASAADRDHDHMRDSWEKHFKLNTHQNDAKKDKDRDGLKNLQEFRAGTNPRRKDTDNDGIRDDHEGAGVIKSFDSATGVLVIDVFDSDTDLTGKVDPATTKIECEGADDRAGEHARHGADDNSGPGNASDDGDRQDNSGPGNASDDGPGHDQGDDRGDDQDEQGEHQQGDDDPAQPACTTADLVAGRTVREAKLNQGDDGPAGVFHEVEVER